MGFLYIFFILIFVGDLCIFLFVFLDFILFFLFLDGECVFSGIFICDGDVVELGLVEGFFFVVNGNVIFFFLIGSFEYCVIIGGDMYFCVIFGEVL